MNYTLWQLKIYLKVCEKQSITKAAEALHLTQPAISIQLKNFQDQFEIPLIEVIGKQLYVTDFGNEIKQIAEKVIREVENIKYKTLLFKGQLSGKLKISVVSTGKYVIPYFLTDFLKLNPGIELVLDVTNKTRVLESLERNEVDFSLVSVLTDKLKLSKIELMKNELFLVSNSKEIKSLSLKKLEKTPLIYREKGSATRNAMEKFITDNQLQVNKKIELTSNEAVKQAVIAGIGNSIMPLIGIRNELKSKQLHIIKVKGLPLVTHWNIVWLSEKKLSPIATAFFDFLEKEKDKIIETYFSN